MYPQDELDELIWRGHRAGWQVAIHAIGDRGIEMCLDGFRESPRTACRAPITATGSSTAASSDRI